MDAGSGPDGRDELSRQAATRGRVLVLSGPSAVGKSTVVRHLREQVPDLYFSVSATTRPPRKGEQDGVDYHFLAPEVFQRRRDAGEFLECCRVYGRQHWYGTLVDEVAPRLAAGKWVVLEIDVEGTLAILEKYPEAITIFVEPSHPDQLLERLRGRGTESAEAMARRLEVARRELLEAHRYRHRVVNENVDDALERVQGILAAEGFAPAAGTTRQATIPPTNPSTNQGVSA